MKLPTIIKNILIETYLDFENIKIGSGISGKIKLEDKTHQNEVISLEELQTVLTENQQQAEADKKQYSVLINGSQSRPYGEVIQLMATLQDAGLNQVGLLTESVK